MVGTRTGASKKGSSGASRTTGPKGLLRGPRNEWGAEAATLAAAKGVATR